MDNYMNVPKILSDLATMEVERKKLQRKIDEVVSHLRSVNLDGECLATWVEIADAMGSTKQTLQSRYRHLSWGGVVRNR